MNGLWLPFLRKILGDFAAIYWSDWDFPAAQLPDFAADVCCFAGDDEFAVTMPSTLMLVEQLVLKLSLCRVNGTISTVAEFFCKYLGTIEVLSELPLFF